MTKEEKDKDTRQPKFEQGTAEKKQDVCKFSQTYDDLFPSKGYGNASTKTIAVICLLLLILAILAIFVLF